MENQRNFEYLNEETRENIKNFFENGVSISVIARSFGVHRTTVWRVIKGKTEYRTKRGGRKRKTSKLEDDFITITLKKNYDRPITTIKKDNFPQHSRWLIRNRDVGVRLQVTFTNNNTNIDCKSKERTLSICFGSDWTSALLLAKCFLRRRNDNNGYLF